jgi:zearalenone synthase (highly reducing iterative type I polyketide synthase)
LSVLEISTELDNLSPIILGPGLDGIERIVKTGDYTVSCTNETAKLKLDEFLSAQGKDISAKLLDISQDITAQEIKDQTFDLVIAFNLSTHVKSLETAVQNVRKILKKGGRVCLVESASSQGVNELAYMMSKNGLTPTLMVHDFEDVELRQLDLMVYTADQAMENDGQSGEITLIEAPDQGEFAQRTSEYIAKSLAKNGYKTNQFTWGSDVSVLKGKTCIALVELEKSILQNLGEGDFKFLKDLVLEVQSILWVVGFGDDPSANMIDGLVRVLRNETPGLSFRTFHAGDRSLSTNKLGELISHVSLSSSPDTEFEVKDGLLNVSRIHEEEGLNNEIHQLVSGTDNEIAKAPLGQAPYPLKLCIPNPGILDSLCFEPDDLPETELEPEKIEIEVKATALK